jgi:hypothetical protein
MAIQKRRLDILLRVERGELSIEDGSRLLAELEEDLAMEAATNTPGMPVTAQPNREAVPVPPMESAPAQSPEPIQQEDPAPRPTNQLSADSLATVATPVERAQGEVIDDPGSEEQIRQRVARWQRWWVYPFAVGVLLTILSAYWMYQGYVAAGLGWGFWLSWFPFALGLLILVVSWYTRTARWLHVRVREDKGKHSSRVSISIPLPLGLAAWVLETFGKNWLPPELRDKGLGEMLRQVEQSVNSDTPFHVWVNEEGSQVEVMIV